MPKDNEERDSLLPQSMDDLRGKRPEELRNLVEVLDAHLKDMHQNEVGELRDLDEDEQRAFDLAAEMRDWCLNKLEEHERVSTIFARRPKSVERVYSNIRKGIDPDSSNVVRMTNSEARDAALHSLDSKSKSARLRADQLDHVDNLIRRDTDIARRILVTENEHYREAWMKMVTKPDGAVFLSEEERGALGAWENYRAMAEGVSASGGYGIPVFIDPSIILTSQGTSNPFLNLARQTTVNTNAWKGVSSAGVSWGFQPEAASTNDNSPTLAQPQVNVFMARGFLPYSIEVGQDYPGFADEMSTLLSSGYDELLVDKFTRGSGSNEPQGLVTALSADTTVQVKVASSGAISSNDPYTVWKALPQRYRRNASWLMSVGVNNAVRQLGTANVYHASTVALPENWADALFGKGVYEDAYMADLTTATNALGQYAVVGDFNNYLIARRGGMSVELIPQLFHSTTGNPTGQRGWFAYARIGGGCINNQGFRILNQT